ncbi:MAG: lamin tail domain-containing protein [bacterium]|nr:lamin tail domain-containing protein [bacterium]MCP4800643.1 lamin tail domain-containing protein [bacterium]
MRLSNDFGKFVVVFACSMLVAGAGMADVVISEVDYDQVSTDSAEWVELYNSDVSSVLLDGMDLVLINGSNSTEYNRFELDGIMISADGFVVIGNDPCATQLITFPATNALQNGAPDIVQIVDRATGALIHGIEYENSGAALFPGDDVTSIGDSNSLEATSIQMCEGEWVLEASTPCGPPACGTVSNDDTTWGGVKAMFR